MCACVLESNHKAIRNSNRESGELSLKDMAVMERSADDLDVMSKPRCHYSERNLYYPVE